MEYTFSLSVLLFRDGSNWIAQCLEHDVAAQGKTIPKVKEAFEKTFVGQVVLDIRNNKKPLEGIKQAPKIFWDRFPQSQKLDEKTPFYLPTDAPYGINARVDDVRIFA